MKSVFTPANIYLPKKDFETWAVIACDQFSSQKDYWDRVEQRVGDRPSTLHMVVPEAYLEDLSLEEASRKRCETMEAYLAGDVLCCLADSFLYVEREVTGGGVRRGLVGKLDLEAYDYLPDSTPPARASEKTVVDRLPPRIRVRSQAALELPHILVLIDDEKQRVIEPFTKEKERLEKVYDFSLMEGGGRICAWRIAGKRAEELTLAVDALSSRKVQFVIGDGNHSLAAAKDCWRQIRAGLSEWERENHPARFALVELCNVYDEGIVFQPIHRIVFDCDPALLLADLERACGDADGRALAFLAGGKKGEIRVKNPSLGGLIDGVQKVLDRWEREKGVKVDYIHDENALLALSKQENTLAIFLPAMDKADLFLTVETSGVFPKKSFSIGHARDKRYYLECRKIQ